MSTTVRGEGEEGLYILLTVALFTLNRSTLSTEDETEVCVDKVIVVLAYTYISILNQENLLCGRLGIMVIYNLNIFLSLLRSPSSCRDSPNYIVSSHLQTYVAI